MQNILVTGANGFVGLHLVKKLSSQGRQVCAVVRSQAAAGYLKQQLPDPAKVTIRVIGNITPATDWSGLFRGIDCVVHLAARVHKIEEKPNEAAHFYHITNTLSTQNLALQAAKARVRRFIYLSSVKVHGEFSPNLDGVFKIFNEQDTPCPQNAYAKSKWQAEKALLEIASIYPMQYVVIRPPLVYGPGVSANFLRMLRLVSKGFPLPLKSIHNRRSLIYIGNLVDIFCTVIDHSAANGETFLVADHELLSTPELVGAIALAQQKSLYLLPFPVALMRVLTKMIGREAIINRLCNSLIIDTTKVQKTLSWQPPFTVSQGLEQTVHWFNQTFSRKSM